MAQIELQKEYKDYKESFAKEKTQNGLMNYLSTNQLKAQKYNNNELVNENIRWKENYEELQIKHDNLDRQCHQFARYEAHPQKLKKGKLEERKNRLKYKST